MSLQELGSDLQHLQDEVLALGSLVESLLLMSVDQLQCCNLDGLEWLGDTERQIHQKRLAVEMGCLQFIAEQRPLGVALRRAVAMIEIASELERIAEHGQRVARANGLAVQYHLRKPVAQIHRLGAGVQALVSGALEAFAQHDVHAVRILLADTQKVDARYEQVYQELLGVMESRPRAVNQAVYISRAAYNLKRAAERVVGICDWVIFSVLGSMPESQPLPAEQGPHTVPQKLSAKVL